MAQTVAQIRQHESGFLGERPTPEAGSRARVEAARASSSVRGERSGSERY